MADRASNRVNDPACPTSELDEGAIAKILRRLNQSFRTQTTPAALGQVAIEQLSQTLQLDQALLYPYEAGDAVLSALVQSGTPGLTPIFPQELHLRQLPLLQQSLAQVKMAMFEQASGNHGDDPAFWSILAAPIGYLETTYGLLLLVRRRNLANTNGAEEPAWSDREQAFVEDVAAQLGGAIAYIFLQEENQGLAQKLNQVRDGFLNKHRQLEEARAQAQSAYEQAQEASRLKSDFLANTSHELRTPLNGMIGFLKLVLDGMADTPEELNEFIEEAHSSALLLLDIINDILDVAKIEAGKMELELTAVQLSELLEEVERKTRLQADNRGLIYEIERPHTHDEVVVYGDYQRILQVMLNLLGNAIKFTKHGSVTISTRIIKKPVKINQQDLPGFVEVRVVDTGIGVSLEQQAKLFKSFSQVDGSRTRQYGGTGLGLVISQKLVEAMGGEVHFYSMGEDLGSTVTFTVPLYQKPVMMVAAEDS